MLSVTNICDSTVVNGVFKPYRRYETAITYVAQYKIVIGMYRWSHFQRHITYLG